MHTRHLVPHEAQHVDASSSMRTYVIIFTMIFYIYQIDISFCTPHLQTLLPFFVICILKNIYINTAQRFFTNNLLEFNLKTLYVNHVGHSYFPGKPLTFSSFILLATS